MITKAVTAYVVIGGINYEGFDILQIYLNKEMADRDRDARRGWLKAELGPGWYDYIEVYEESLIVQPPDLEGIFE